MKVSSIRRNKAACRLVRAQQSAALALDLPISQVLSLFIVGKQQDSLGELSLLGVQVVCTVVVEVTQRQTAVFFLRSVHPAVV